MTPASRLDRARILIVDDDATNRLAFRAALDALGHDVVSVDSGEAALLELLRGEFALIVLDVQMPGMDGFETARLIRGRRRCHRIPIVFLTAISKQDSHVRRGYSLGAVDYLFKPVDLDILRSKVQSFVGLFEQRREALRQAERIYILEREQVLESERARHEKVLLDAQRAANEALRRKAAELARSNAELEQFAYVASHDLQEPLRMVASFTQLLADRYGDQLDAEAHEYIHFAVDGAKRMRALIQDLLVLSRLGSRGAPFSEGSLRDALDDALEALKTSVAASGAEIEIGELPTLEFDRRQLTQVFQNLVGNALKFVRERPPVVRVEARQEQNDWVVSVIDNGIGIEASCFDRIFRIFERLHPSEDYRGSGIGLAIVKKVIERHGGRVWVESTWGVGSRFSFTLPAARAESTIVEP